MTTTPKTTATTKQHLQQITNDPAEVLHLNIWAKYEGVGFLITAAQKVAVELNAHREADRPIANDDATLPKVKSKTCLLLLQPSCQ